MNLLELANNLARNVGLPETDKVLLSPERHWREVVSLSELVGEELSRRVEWDALRKRGILLGQGAPFAYDLEFARQGNRMLRSLSMTYNGQPVRALSAAEWANITPIAGAPRYFCVTGEGVELYPYLASGEQCEFVYQSNTWCRDANNSIRVYSQWRADTDVILLDPSLFLKGLIVRWRRQKGMDYADYEAEYEQALADLADSNDGYRL